MITKNSEVSCRSLTLTLNNAGNEGRRTISGVLGGGMVFGLMFGVTLAMFGLAYMSSLVVA